LAFVSSISTVSIPKTLHEALSHPGWKQAMIDEMIALESNQTWSLFHLLLENLLLVAGGCLMSKWDLMDRLID